MIDGSWMRTGGKLFVVAGLALSIYGVLADLGPGGSMGALISGGTFLFIGLSWWVTTAFLNPKASDDSELEEWGRPSNATVISAEQVGTGPGGGPMVKLRVEVTPSAERPFQATKTLEAAVVPEPGTAIRVKFDPNRRKNFILA